MRLMFTWVLRRYAASTVLLVPKPFGGRMTASVDMQLHGDKEWPLSGVTNSGTIARSVRWHQTQALVYDILPLEEGAGKRCSECEVTPFSEHRLISSTFLQTPPDLVALLKGTLDFISEQLSTDAVSALRKVWVLTKFINRCIYNLRF